MTKSLNEYERRLIAALNESSVAEPYRSLAIGAFWSGVNAGAATIDRVEAQPPILMEHSKRRYDEIKASIEAKMAEMRSGRAEKISLESECKEFLQFVGKDTDASPDEIEAHFFAGAVSCIEVIARQSEADFAFEDILGGLLAEIGARCDRALLFDAEGRPC
jgi:hypothetical protein